MFSEEIAWAIDVLRLTRGVLANTTLSALIGIAVCIRYFYKNRHRAEEKEILISGVSLFISTLGILPGFAIILLGLDKETCSIIQLEQKVVIAAGIVLIGTAVQGFIRNNKA